MAKIYSLTIDVDGFPVETKLFYTEAERDAAALEAIKEEWRSSDGSMPDDWYNAYKVLHAGYCDLYICTDDHEIDPAQLSLFP